MSISSIINGIFYELASFDKEASSEYEIDSKNEYDKLSAFLSGNENIGGYLFKNSDNKGQNYFSNLLNNLKSKFSEIQKTKEQKEAENINELGKEFNRDNFDKNTAFNILKSINENNIQFINEDIIRSFIYRGKEVCNPKEYEKIFNHLEKVIKTAIKKLGLEDKVKETEEEYKKAGCEFHDELYLITSFEIIKKYEYKREKLEQARKDGINDIDDTQNAETIMQDIRQKAREKEVERLKAKQKNRTGEKTYEDYAEEYFIENNGKTKSPRSRANLNFGAGGYDKDSKEHINGNIEPGFSEQKNGNCWLMAGINSMANNVKGREIINQHIYHDSVHGVTVVHLAEAEKLGLGKDGKGIYIISDKELAGADYAWGDADIRAFNIAIKRFFDEKPHDDSGFAGEDYGILKGNTDVRLYEIISGQKAVECTGEDDIPNGIALIQQPSFDKIYELVQSGKGFVTLGLRLNDEKLASILNASEGGGHAVSVVGTKNGMFICQESNNNEGFAKAFTEYWQDENGTWNFLINKDDFAKYVNMAGTYIP